MKRRVAVIDDDVSVREALPPLLMFLGYDVEVFSSAEDFLASPSIDSADCLVLDVSMPGMSGPELHIELKGRGNAVPVVFVTAQADDSLRSPLLTQGAVECLFKPFGDDALSCALDRAFGKTPSLGAREQ
jgi:FixJ family two-component response regulator